MAIAPISSVNFRNNYSQVNFEGKRKEHKYGHHSVTNTLKSIPVATLIAMSPIISPAQTIQEKVVASCEYPEALVEHGKTASNCYVQFVSTDGNDEDAEKIYVVKTGDENIKRNVNGKIETYSTHFSSRLQINAIECRNVTRTYSDSPNATSKEYYVLGPNTYSNLGYDTPQGRVRGTEKHNQNASFQISEQFYKWLNQTLGDMVEYKNSSKVIDGDAEFRQSLYDSSY